MKRGNFWLLLLFFLNIPNGQTAEAPVEMLENVLHHVLTLDKQVKSDNREEIFKKLESEVFPYFSFDYMAEWVARPFEQELSATQYSQLIRQLQGLFLTRLLQALTPGESDSHFKMLAPRPYLRARELVVTVQIYQQQKLGSELHFRLYRNKEGWKIFDMVINQESTMQHFLNYFQQQVKQDGVTAVFGK
jgi:phospholipid transport system substrate-binding protein